MVYDLLLKNATVIDPAQNLDGRFDVAVDGDRITAVAPSIVGEARQVVDLEGKILTPGWIDIHAHIFAGFTTWGFKADALCLSTGVTTIVDAGSPGWANFLAFKEFIVEPARTQMLTFVHISGIGLTYGPAGEMTDMRYAAPEQTAFVIQEWPDICVGVKVRQAAFQVGDNGVEPLRLAVEAGRLSGTPVMVHIGAGVALPDVLAGMRPGDIATHCYQGHGDHILGDGTEVIAEVWQARERGILFDLGHGGGSFNFEVAKRALANGFVSDIISTDIHSSSFESTVQSLPDAASKLLNLGIDLRDIVRQTTAAAAASIHRDDELGTLRPGTIADLAAFEILEGEYEFFDTHRQPHPGSALISPVLTVRAGQVYRPDDLRAEVEQEARRSAQTIRAIAGSNAAALQQLKQ